MYRTALTALVVLTTAAASVPVASGATASKADKKQAKSIITDCTKHGHLTKHYRVSALKLAKKSANKGKAKASCPASISSALVALTGKPGKNSTGAIIRDCANHGSLKKRYKLKTLRKALKTMPADARDYSTCPEAIRSQISALA